MSARTRPVRTAAALAAGAVLLSGLLSGCGEQGSTQTASDSTPATPATPATRATAKGAVASQAPATPAAGPTEPQSVPVENTPTELPPGDPGTDAPSVPDPGRPKGDREHGAPALTVVPTQAMLDATTVSQVLGGQWQESAGAPMDCATAADAVADRTTSFRSADGRVLETVATHKSAAAADRVVDAVAGQLRDCGWSAASDPRLGSASAAMSNADGTQTAVIISADGVTATVVGSGAATARRARWSGLLDLAMGNSCAATPEGCH